MYSASASAVYSFCVIFVVVSAVLNYTRKTECVIFYVLRVVKNYIVVISSVISSVVFVVAGYTPLRCFWCGVALVGAWIYLGISMVILFGLHPGCLPGLPPLCFPEAIYCRFATLIRLCALRGCPWVVGSAPSLAPVPPCPQPLLW